MVGLKLNHVSKRGPWCIQMSWWKLNIIDSVDVLSPVRRQAISRINFDLLLIRPIAATFSEILNQYTMIFMERMITP